MVHRRDAVFAIVESATEVLLVANRKSSGRKEWSLPGGRVDSGESALRALTREVREETGIKVINWSKLIYTCLVKHRGDGSGLDRFVEVHQAGDWNCRDGRATDPEDLLRFEDESLSGERLGVVAGFFSDLPPDGSLVRNLRRYVREPILDWRSLPWEGPRHYEYLVTGDGTVERLDPPE